MTQKKKHRLGTVSKSILLEGLNRSIACDYPGVEVHAPPMDPRMHMCSVGVYELALESVEYSSLPENDNKLGILVQKRT